MKHVLLQMLLNVHPESFCLTTRPSINQSTNPSEYLLFFFVEQRRLLLNGKCKQFFSFEKMKALSFVLLLCAGCCHSFAGLKIIWKSVLCK